MFLSKKNIFIILTIVFFSGCADDIAKSMVVGAVGNVGTYKYDLEGDKPLFLEAIDNEEFKEFLLSKNIIEGLKEEDIIYIDSRDNLVPRNPVSSKILISKNIIYFISVDTWQNFTRLNKDNYREFDYDIEELSFKKWNIKTEIADNELILYFTLKKEAKSYEYVTNALRLVISPLIRRRPFNNLEKLKEVIDERVTFYKNKVKNKGDNQL